MQTNSITVNNQEILIINEGNEKFVAIRPICEAIGVNYSSQLRKIKEDEILNSVVALSTTTGTDEKNYQMTVLPLRFVFGWLFTINPKNVKPEVQKHIIKYKLECYNALFDTFTKRSSILKERTKLQVEMQRLEEELKSDKKYLRIQELKSQMSKTTKQLNSMDKDVITGQLNLFGEEEKQQS